MKKITNDKFLLRLKNIHGDEYEPLEDYKGAKTKINVKHNICGNIINVRPDNLYNGGCVHCGMDKMKKKQRKSNDEFVKNIQMLVKDEYIFLEEYINSKTKINVKHLVCDTTYKVSPVDFLSGRRCPSCKNERISKSNTNTHDEFLSVLGDSLESDYKLLGEYVNSREKIKITHIKCGLIYHVNPQHLINGKRCPICSMENMGIEKRKTHKEFIEQLGDSWHKEHILLSKYEKQDIKVNVFHKKCQKVFSIVPYSLIAGRGCSYCKQSHGEKAVEKWLCENKVEYKPQYAFDDCVYKSKLFFDFAIFDKENKLIALIEYQGVQHYEPIDFFGGSDALRIQKIKDDIKKNYAINIKIPLIEIHYEDNVAEALNKLIPR